MSTGWRAYDWVMRWQLVPRQVRRLVVALVGGAAIAALAALARWLLP